MIRHRPHHRPGPLLAAADPSHGVAILAVVIMNALFLIGLAYAC